MGKPVSLTMSQTGLRLTLLLSLLTIAEVLGNCEDYTCRHEYPDGVSVTEIPVNFGDKCHYFTQKEGQKYYPPPRGVECITKYNRGDFTGDCPFIKFHCKSLHLWNRAPKNIRSSNGLKINLKIERWTRGGQGGRHCK